MATLKDYEQINTCLYELGFVLRNIGVTEFSISKEKRCVTWDTEKQIDNELLDKLCTSVAHIYKEYEKKNKTG